jgi:serine/threonine-protein kinase HipA
MDKEPNTVRLFFLGQPMAALSYREDDGAHFLEFDSGFLQLGHDLSPVYLPLERLAHPRVFRIGDSPFAGGLPGLIADSLPDAWGDRVMRAEMPEIRTIVGKLAAIGRRGPGAITFEPAIGPGVDADASPVNLSALAARAAALATSQPAPLGTDAVNAALARGGSSLGGAFPKTTAHLPFGSETLERREILVGGATPAGHVPCIMKFSPADPDGGGTVEFAYMKLAATAGIRVPRSCLVHDGERRHFAVERFDRTIAPDGTTRCRHVHTLSGMLHQRASDGQLDYSDFMRLTRRLCGHRDAVECFRRAVFNLLALNRDDHGRNHAFLYDETTRTWTLAPAYDMNPNVANVLIGLSWLGSAAIPQKFVDLIRLAELGGIRPATARTIFGEVEEAVLGGWRRMAAECGVPNGIAEIWERGMLTQTRQLRADAAVITATAKRSTVKRNVAKSTTERKRSSQE